MRLAWTNLSWPGSRFVGVLAVGVGAAAVSAGAAVTEPRANHAISAQTCVWRTTPTANPHPLLYNRFNSVAATSPDAAWAVGDYYSGTEGGPHGAFIERWDGHRWRLATVPLPGGADLWSVAASGARDVWAVGATEGDGQLIEHWDGARWQIAPAPHPLASILFAVAARTPRDAWAVGTHNRGSGGKTLIEHWNGTRWSVVPSPSPPAARGRRRYATLRTVSVISRTNAWAAGYWGTAGYSGTVPPPATRTLIEHWDGRGWSIAPSPNVRTARGVTNDILFSISGSRQGDVWAVGSWGSLPNQYGGKGDHALALRWDGRRWLRVPTRSLAERSLLSGVLVRYGQTWAVGDRRVQPHQTTLIEHWDRRSWSVVRSPSGFALAAISALRARRCGRWARTAGARWPYAADLPLYERSDV